MLVKPKKKGKPPEPRAPTILYILYGHGLFSAFSFITSAFNQQLINYVMQYEARLRQHENYGLRRKSGVETIPNTHPLNIVHNIFKPLWDCADMQHREKSLHSSQLVLFQTVP